jgi:predicted nucleotidyltransferase
LDGARIIIFIVIKKTKINFSSKRCRYAICRTAAGINIMVGIQDSVSKHIQKMVERIVAQFQPEKIILFGSHARGDGTADSDVDLLIVMPVEGSKRAKQLEIRAAIHDVRIPKDILISRPEEFQWRKDIVGTIERPAVREGRVLYARE